MKNFRNYLLLHLNILLFSLTSVFSKLASIQYNKNGLHAPLLYVFLFLMIANCGIYAIAWQQVIKNSHCPPPMPTKVSIFYGHRSGQSQFFMNSFPYRTSSES